MQENLHRPPLHKQETIANEIIYELHSPANSVPREKRGEWTVSSWQSSCYRDRSAPNEHVIPKLPSQCPIINVTNNFACTTSASVCISVDRNDWMPAWQTDWRTDDWYDLQLRCISRATWSTANQFICFAPTIRSPIICFYPSVPQKLRTPTSRFPLSQFDCTALLHNSLASRLNHHFILHITLNVIRISKSMSIHSWANSWTFHSVALSCGFPCCKFDKREEALFKDSINFPPTIGVRKGSGFAHSPFTNSARQFNTPSFTLIASFSSL